MKKTIVFYGATYSRNMEAIYNNFKRERLNFNFVWLVDSPIQIQSISTQIDYIVRGETKADFVLSKADIIFEDKFHKTYPSSLSYNTPIINLWHGVGLKEVELNNPINGFLADRVMSRYIMSSTIYKNQSYFVTTSTYMTQHFETNTIVKSNHFLELGMPRLDGVKISNRLHSNEKLILWAPTFRDNLEFDKILPSSHLDSLVKALKSSNSRLIFSPHPNMWKDPAFLSFCQLVKSSQFVRVLKKTESVYDYVASIDYAIVDYSSIFYDLMYTGMDKFIRYIPDYDSYSKFQPEFKKHYFQDTYGPIVKDVDQLCQLIMQPNFGKFIDETKKRYIKEKYFNKQSVDAAQAIIDVASKLTVDQASVTKGLYSFNAEFVVNNHTDLSPLLKNNSVLLLHFSNKSHSLNIKGVREIFILDNESVEDFYKRIFYVELRKYDFDFWKHIGTDINADEVIPRKFGIQTRGFLADYKKVKGISLIQALSPKRLRIYKDDRIFDKAISQSNRLFRLIFDVKIKMLKFILRRLTKL
ncbi:CDP-glycerol glycerophosphotransferase family protein [Leuconostoc falkenbergense]|uniref:CDP-glycerol glycerophosphotransferase family protein n=1 Tax=Leuconostoc falkenbergense TaxID=2766470 RepID=A0ABT7S116_9LACO|nr:CDP-glycerol glycerophosphotransferase family protein [Leuconostoc falkenbergense]MDM7647269.1 CDP-glycerol glycerophosphotransferase family protein [Leuconostoc falkenbergense]